MKRILIIVGIIIIVALGLYLGRSYIFKSAGTSGVSVDGPVLPANTGGSPAVEENPETLAALAEMEFFDYWLDLTDRSIYAITADGNLYHIPAGGAPEKIYSAGSKEISLVKPAPQGNSVLIEGGSQPSPYFSILNPVDRSNKFLPLGAVVAAWSPDGKEIAFLKDQALNIFTLASGKSRFITNLNLTDVLLDWKKPREIYLGSRPAAGVPGQWWKFSLDKGFMQQLTEELPGLIVRWTGDGQSGLQFTNQADAGKNNLRLIKIVEPAISLHLLTLPEKCTPAGPIIYCGEINGADASQLPDTYYQHQYAADSIVRLTTTGFPAKKTIYFSTANQLLDVYHPTLVGPFLYFLNRADNKLYSLALQ